MEQAAKGLDDAVDKAVKLEQRLADVTKRLGENSQATKTTKFWYDKANAAAEQLWMKNTRELNKIEGIVKRTGSSIDKVLIGGVNRFGEAVDKAGKRFDTSISGKFVKIEKEIKNAEQAAKRLEAARIKAEKDPMIGPMQRAKFGISQGTQYPTPEQLGLKRQPTGWEQFRKLFTQDKSGTSTSGNRRESHFINALANTARVGAGATGGGAHYGMIGGMANLLKAFFLQPTGLQLVESVAAGVITAGAAAIALAEPVARRSRQARAYGQAYGAFEASQYSIGPYRDVNAGMAATRMARDPTSQQRIAMMQLGLNPQAEFGKTGPAQLAGQNVALKNLMDKFKDFGQFLAYFNNTALKDMFNLDDVYRIQGADKKKLEQAVKESAENEKMLYIDKQTTEIYTDLNKHLGLFGQVVETVTTKQLAGLASFIDSFLVTGIKGINDFSAALETIEGTLKIINLLTGRGPTKPGEESTWSKITGGISKGFDKLWGGIAPPTGLEAPEAPGTPGAGPNKPYPMHKEDFPDVPAPTPAAPHAEAGKSGWRKLFGFQTGAYSVPETGPAMLHQDELVMPAKEASAFRNMLNSTTTEGGKDFGEFNRELMKSSDIFVDLNKQMKPLADNMSALNMELTSGRYLAERYGGGGGEGGGGGGGGGATTGPVAFKDMVDGGGAPLAPGGGGGIFPSVTGEKATPLMQEAGKGFGGRDPRPGATAKQNAAIVADVFRKAGASEEGIAGMMANIQSESAFKGGATEAGGTGVGLWQFSGTSANSEKGRFLAAMKEQGKDWRDPKAQAEYQIENLQKNYPNVWKEMQTHAAAGQQAADYLLGYERPKGTRIIGGKPVATGSYALQRQQEYLGGVPSVSSYTGGDGGGIITGGGKAPSFVGSASSQGGATGHWADDLKKMKDNHLLTNDQCVSLASAAVGIKSGSMREGGHVSEWRPGEDVMTGDIKPGTPISTFLDREGKQSSRYAGGGIGTMGARLDHAAEFLKYLTDEKGKRTGMEVLEQFKGSAPHIRDYYNNPIVTGDYRDKNVRYNPGFGENTAANYRAIKTASGEYLGGTANAMARQDEMTKVAAAYGPKTKDQMMKDAAAYGPQNRPQMQASAQPGRVDPYGRDPTPHLGDMSQFHKDASPVVTIFNKSGSNVNLQTASIGSAQGNFDT